MPFSILYIEIDVVRFRSPDQKNLICYAWMQNEMFDFQKKLCSWKTKNSTTQREFCILHEFIQVIVFGNE